MERSSIKWVIHKCRVEKDDSVKCDLQELEFVRKYPTTKVENPFHLGGGAR